MGRIAKYAGILIGICLSAFAAGVPEAAYGQMGGRLLIFNTLVDLYKGDLWEYITQEEVGRYLYIYPERYEVIGIGTTSGSYRMGEVIVKGRVERTSFLWGNPEWPYRFQRIHEGVFPWVQVAVFDPKKGITLNLNRTEDLHAGLIERMRKERVRICAIYIEAVSTKVEYSLTYRIPKSGLDLAVPEGEGAYLRVFKDGTLSRWVFYGIYVDEEIASSCGMVPAQPLLLVGFNRDKRNGGLVRMARVRSARVRYYTIEDFQVLQADLLVSDVRVKENKVSIDIKNGGDLTAKHVKVRLLLPDSKREWEAVLPELKPHVENTVRFLLKKSPSDKNVVVYVDPENEILEANEKNNRYERKQRLFGW